MPRNKISDIAEDARITEDEMKKIVGGIETIPLPEIAPRPSIGTWPTPETPTNSRGHVARIDIHST
jgi:hypothetical protein